MDAEDIEHRLRHVVPARLWGGGRGGGGGGGFFFFNDTATTEIYTLSLHDALPICQHIFLETD